MKTRNSWDKPKIKVNLLKREENFISCMLFDLLSCITPHPNYVNIVATIKKYIPKNQKTYTDGIGNIIVKVGTDYTTMFSCHIDMIFRQTYLSKEESITDTVRKLDLFIAADQKHADANFVWGGVITEYRNNKHIYTPTTLGADDKAGIYILLKLIRAKVPGLYIFHIGEELGGIGSSDIVARSPKLVAGIKRAIAFDRMDYLDIVDTQRGRVCCSQEFIKAFAIQLNELVLAPYHLLKDTYRGAIGSFTDTANYKDLIPECTNLSVGYFSQHTAEECLDIFWLEDALTPGILKVDWEALPTERIIAPRKLFKGSSYVRKYTRYSDINYMTERKSLPPWDLSKGIIQSCNNIGMRRLIKNYIETVKSDFVIHEDILVLLKENAELKNKIQQNKTNVILFNNTPLASVNGNLFDLKSRQIAAFGTLTSLLVSNFKIYDENFSSYTEKIAEYTELLKWAWEDETVLNSNILTDPNPQAKLKLMGQILSEIVVINTTLVKESQYDIDGIILQANIDSNLANTIVTSVNFVKNNWFILGYPAYTSVKENFVTIRDKIATHS